VLAFDETEMSRLAAAAGCHASVRRRSVLYRRANLRALRGHSRWLEPPCCL
jgi:hypothetical protein